MQNGFLLEFEAPDFLGVVLSGQGLVFFWVRGMVLTMNWGAIRVWAAVILLLDASFGLWNHNRFSKMAPKINIFWIAMIEGGAAVSLLIVHYCFH